MEMSNQTQSLQTPSDSSFPPHTRVNTKQVVSVGLGKPLENGEYEPLPVKVGDQVLWGDYVGTRVEFGRGNDYIFVRASDIFAAW